MRKNHILKVLSLIAAVCIAAGCNGSEIAETATNNSAQVATSAADTAAEETDSEISASSELEINYVDDDGIIYYKNPTEWTYEMVNNALSIEGEKSDKPLTFEGLGNKYSLNKETLTYFDDSKSIGAGLIYNENEFGSVLLTDCANIDDRNNKELGFIFLRNLPEEWHEDFPNITVNGIGIGSTRNSVITAFGIPYSETYQDKISNGVLIYKSEPEQMNGTLIVFLRDGKVVSFSITLKD